MFYVGQKVVCVDAVSSKKYLPDNYRAIDSDMDGLRESCIYTVRRVGVVAGCIWLWLAEIERRRRGSYCERYGEIGFDSRRFRPVVERKTDISIFTDMLTPKTVEVEP